MPIERTLSIIKPDATRRNLTGQIAARLEQAGLRIVAQKRVRLTLGDAEAFYNVHKQRPFFRGLVEFMSSGPVVVQVLEGEDAIARDRRRAEETLKHLRAISDGDHKVHYADLSRLSEMKRVAGEIAASEPRIDILINNAGAMFNTRKVTGDGLEMTFALNHMAYFVITNLLLANLGAGARIVSTASDAHGGAKLDFSDLQSSRHYSG